MLALLFHKPVIAIKVELNKPSRAWVDRGIHFPLCFHNFLQIKTLLIPKKRPWHLIFPIKENTPDQVRNRCNYRCDENAQESRWNGKGKEAFHHDVDYISSSLQRVSECITVGYEENMK
jgi:hypothetical protein